jgi:integrase
MLKYLSEKKIMKKSPQLQFTDHFLQFIKASRSGRRLTPSGKRITKGTIINYEHVYDLIKVFESKSIDKLRIQLLHRASMRTLQREKNYWKRFFVHFSTFLYKEKKYYDNCVSNVFKTIKTFLNYLQKEKGFIVGNYHKSFRIPLQQSSPVVLLPEQLQFLITNKDFEGSLNPYLKRARDIFVFGCTVALRFSDLMNLRKSNLVQTEAETYLNLFTQKTGSEIKVPLPEYVLDIIKRNKRKSGKFLLPRLSSTNLNLQIKKLICFAGWNNTLPKYISLKGKMIELKSGTGNTWKFYEHITAHTMRRTAITTLLIMGVPENIVRKISGHAPGSKEFYKYIAIAQEYLNCEIKKAYKKLIENTDISPLKIST